MSVRKRLCCPAPCHETASSYALQSRARGRPGRPGAFGGVCMRVKVWRYLLRSNVVRNPRKAYRSLAQDTTVADNRAHYDLHQFDKRQGETLMATE